MRDVRLCVAGDSLVTGVGDPKALGWVGRVAARTRGVSLITYNLGVAGDRLADVQRRLHAELPPRLTGGDDHRLVLSAGVEDARTAVDPAQSCEALTSITAAAGVPCLVVGPPPVGGEDVQARLSRLDVMLGATCERLSVPYIPTLPLLSHHPDWHKDLDRSADGIHPGQTGYGLLAYLVLHGGWHSWLGLPEPETPAVRRGRTRS